VTHEMSSTSARSGMRMVPAKAIILIMEAARTAARNRVRLQAPRGHDFEQANS
jgi:hypothetical protein